MKSDTLRLNRNLGPHPLLFVLWMALAWVLGGNLLAQAPAFSVTDPESLSRTVGEPAVFRVRVSGTGSFSYEWRKNGQTVPGATGPELQIASVTFADAGLYTVRVTQVGGTSMSSSPAGLAVNSRKGGALDLGFLNVTVDNEINAAAVQPDGKVVIAGDFTRVNGVQSGGVARVGADGVLDGQFRPFVNGVVHAVAVQADGHVLLGGAFTQVNGESRLRIARVHRFSGGLESSWLRTTAANGPVYSLLVTGEGILVGGEFTAFNGSPRSGLVRLAANGALDNRFDLGSGFNGAVRVLAADAENRILVGGGFTQVGGQPQKYLARLLVTGQRDPSFALGADGLDAEVWSIAKDKLDGVETGKWVIGGRFTQVQGASRGHVARLKADGSVDLEFGSELVGANGLVRAVVVLGDGTTVLGGDFTAINGAACRYGARLDRGGNTDAEFQANTGGFNSQVRAVVDVGGGSVVLCGAFTEMGGVRVGNCVRLTSEGRLLRALGGDMDLFNFKVFCVVPDRQGRLLVGGDYSMVNGTRRAHLVRLMPDGSLDGSFAVGGGPNAHVIDVKLGADQSIYIAGAFTAVAGRVRPYIAKLNKDGILDESFGGDSADVVPNAAVARIAVQKDGKILILGWFEKVGGVDRNGYARLGTDGRLDLSYVVSGPPIGVGWQGCVALDEQDRAYVGGGFPSFNGDPKAINLVRLNTDGAVDTTFPGYGANLCNGGVVDIVKDAEGRIWIAGDFTSVQGKRRLRVARLDMGGTVDQTFGAAMESPQNSGPTGRVSRLAVDSRGRAVIAGDFAYYGGQPFYKVARLLPDGSLDPDFSSKGVEYNLLSTTNTIALDLEGRILLGGVFKSVNGVGRNCMARLDEDGRLDLSFGGKTLPESVVVNAVALDSAGRCLVAGEFWRMGAVQRNCAARINSNGALDAFNPALDGPVNAIAVQPDGKVLLGGRFLGVSGGARSYLARFESSGALDPTYGDPDRRLNGEVYAVALQADGKVIAGGSFTQMGGVICRGVVRTTVDGLVDVGFAAGLSGTNGRVFAVAVQPDGGILIGGDFDRVHDVPCGGFARLNADGSLDTSFQSGLGTGSIVVKSIAVASGGKIVVGGRFAAVSGVHPEGIARLNSDGGLDGTFARGLSGAEGGVDSVVIDSAGRIVLGGGFVKVHGVARGRLARLHSDGTLDLAFAQESGGADNGVRAVAVHPTDGTVYAGGSFRVYNGNFRNSLVRVYDSGWDADLQELAPGAGSLEPGFGSGFSDYRLTGAAPDLRSLQVQARANEQRATIRARVNGGSFTVVDSLGRSGSLIFAGGENRVEVLVTSSNGLVSRTYSVGANSQQPVLQLRYDGKPLVRAGVAPVVVDCGNGLQGDVIEREILLVNIGSGPMVLGAVTKQGGDAQDIFVGQPEKETLQPGESTTVPLRMTARNLGLHQVQLRIGTNVLADENQYLLQLRWSGVDRTLPETTITNGPSGVQRRTSVQLQFEGQDNVGVAFYEGRINGGAWTRVSSPHRMEGLTDGSYQFEVRAVDLQGNRDGSPAVSTWLVQSYVAVKGSAVPGAGVDPRIPVGSVWESFGVPAINANGTLAFVGTWSSGTKVRESGVFKVREGVEAVLLIKVGEAAIGSAGTVFGSFLDPLLADDDSMVIPATLVRAEKGRRLSTSVDRGIWRVSASGDVTLVAREGDVAGEKGERWSTITGVVASRGVVAFTGTLVRKSGLVTSADDTALWVYDVKTSTCRMVLREGDDVLGSKVALIAALASRGRESGHGRMVSDEGDGLWRIALRTTLKDGRHAVAVVTPERGVEVLPFVSGAVTGGAGESWVTFGMPILDGGSGLVFGADLKQPGLRYNVGAIATAAFDGTPSSLKFLYRTGETVPGLNGGIFKQFGQPVASSAEAVAFGATLQSNPVFGFGKGSDEVLCWKQPGRPLRVVARTGAQAVWAADEGLHLWSSFDGLAMADSGNGFLVTGTALQVGGGRSAKPIKALWAGGNEGRLQRLLRVGERRTVGAKTETLSGFDVLSQVLGSPSQRRSFNEEGQLVLREFYTNGGQSLRVMRYRD